MHWLGDNPWAVWLAIAVLLGIAEIASLDLVLAMLATGALGGVVTSLVTDSLPVQVIVAVVVAVAMLGVVRPGLARRLHAGPELVLGTDSLIGVRAVAIGRLSADKPGQVRLEGVLWSARPYDDTLIIEDDTVVEVLQVRGATVYVHPTPTLEA
ncbi:NfeD family protein [Nocardioides sp.]|uniref:NfeD family protein n=1 Tax=Nocardioides sp. TaxID=35761 RepID=UPI0039E52026